MKIHIVMAQRKCAYIGQYAPEVLACMGEFGAEDNPGYLLEARRKNLETNEFDAVEIVTLKVDDGEIDKRLFPLSGPVDAEVK